MGMINQRVPFVIESSGRGDREMDIFSRLLKDRIVFLTGGVDDEIANLIVRPEIWERYHRAARRATAMLAQGFLQKQDEVIHVLVQRIEDLSALMTGVDSQSRDFR